MSVEGFKSLGDRIGPQYGVVVPSGGAKPFGNGTTGIPGVASVYVEDIDQIRLQVIKENAFNFSLLILQATSDDAQAPDDRWEDLNQTKLQSLYAPGAGGGASEVSIVIQREGWKWFRLVGKSDGTPGATVTINWSGK
jgi:hypothetical protein